MKIPTSPPLAEFAGHSKIYMKKQLDVKSASQKIRKFYRENRRMPSHKEICEIFSYRSKASSQYLAKKLAEADLVEKDEKGKLIPKKLLISQLGFVQAGMPAYAEEQVLDSLSLDEYLVDQPETSYVLKVDGDSMIEAGIFPNDLMIVDTAKRAKMGDIVVANVDGEFTLKYLRLLKGRIALIPANRNYSPIYPRNNLTINGVVVSVVRKYEI